MSIEVAGLTKLYGSQEAVKDISFTINSGEIVGFLGPNGAGKSTTMKIICGYLSGSQGKVKVCGLDVDESGILARKKIGYLPEHNPLYLDMFVAEYLHFAAKISGLKKPEGRIEEIISLTGLTPERNKKIGQLSKGYRQRVGLAQALIHDPEVLILDEPTSGLDPNQVQEIRNLIKDIGKNKTVMLSTHIMQEVEAMCSRVIIINKGELRANGTVDDVKQKLGNKSTKLIQVTFREAIAAEGIKKLKGVKSVESISDSTFHVTSKSDVDLAAVLFKFAVDNNTIITEQSEKTDSLEAVFQQLTSND
jgi:ABC-2 type transport system ATP-binding protein